MMRKIIHLSIPITLTNMVGLIALLCNISVLGELKQNNIYLLGLYLPLNFWMVALFESFRVPATAFSAAIFDKGEKHRVGAQLLYLLLASLILVILPILCILLFPSKVSTLLSIHAINDWLRFKQFSLWMLSAHYVLVVFYITGGIFNGIGQSQYSLYLALAGVLLSTVLTAFLAKYTALSLLSLPAAAFMSYSILLAYIFYVLYREQILNFKSVKSIFITGNGQRVWQLAFPVWLTYLSLAFALWGFNSLLIPYGDNVVAGFGVAYRIQTLLLLPALSIGTAVGILINKNQAQDNGDAILKKGLLLCLISYMALSIITYYGAHAVALLIVRDTLIVESVAHYLKTVCFSYIGLALTLCYCVTLDQVGQGFKSFLFTLFGYLFSIILAIILMNIRSEPEGLYQSIVLGNILSGLITLLLANYKSKNKRVLRYVTN